MSYSSIPNILTSDHIPVIGSFVVPIYKNYIEIFNDDKYDKRYNLHIKNVMLYDINGEKKDINNYNLLIYGNFDKYVNIITDFNDTTNI